jgi:predicted nucleic acid-binding protein
MDAFDADVLIYAAVPGHPLGRRVLALFSGEPPGSAPAPAGVGSTLLLPELLTKPTRDQADGELIALTAVLARLELRPLDQATAQLAVALGAIYGLRAADAVHLATAVGVGADRFLTNNRRDFPHTISEIDITYPDQLVDPGPAQHRQSSQASNR